MGSMGTSKSTSSMSSPYSGLIASFGKAFLPAAKQFGAQQSEALRTGGVNAQIPSINRAVDASRQAGSSSNQETQAALARAGLSGTSFGANVAATNQQAGAAETAAIPSSVAGQFISSVPGTAATGVGAAQGAAASSYTGKATSTGSFMDQLQQGMAMGIDPGGVFSSKGGKPGGGSMAAPTAMSGMGAGGGAGVGAGEATGFGAGGGSAPLWGGSAGAGSGMVGGTSKGAAGAAAFM